MGWQDFKRGVVREALFFLGIVGSGAALILISLLVLLINANLDATSKMITLFGTKIIFMGYPAFLIIRTVFWLFKEKQGESRSS